MATKTKKKNNKKPAAVQSASGSRMRKLTRKDKKTAVKQTKKIPNSFKIFATACKHLWQHKRIFIGVFVVYLVLYSLFVKGLAANFQLSDTRQLIKDTLGDELSTPATAATLFGVLIGTAGSTTSDAAAVYQIILFVLVSLTVIWVLRQTFDKDRKAKLKIRDAFYLSAYPLVPYLIVCVVVILQFLPALIGLSLFSIVSSNGLAVGAPEQIMWFLIMLLGFAISVYFIASSLFATYIVTLPNIRPLNALRSARKLVKYRRWSIIARVLFLPVVIAVFFVIIFFPLVLVLPVAAEILFLLLSLFLVLFIHTYFYILYRELL